MDLCKCNNSTSIIDLPSSASEWRWYLFDPLELGGKFAHPRLTNSRPIRLQSISPLNSKSTCTCTREDEANFRLHICTSRKELIMRDYSIWHTDDLLLLLQSHKTRFTWNSGICSLALLPNPNLASPGGAKIFCTLQYFTFGREQCCSISVSNRQLSTVTSNKTIAVSPTNLDLVVQLFFHAST